MARGQSVLLDAASNMKKQQIIKPETSEELWTREDVARRWKSHVETVSRAHAKGLRVIRFGATSIRYRPSDVVAYEQQCAA